jgi:hypothetical protein
MVKEMHRDFVLRQKLKKSFIKVQFAKYLYISYRFYRHVAFFAVAVLENYRVLLSF